MSQKQKNSTSSRFKESFLNFQKKKKNLGFGPLETQKRCQIIVLLQTRFHYCWYTLRGFLSSPSQLYCLLVSLGQVSFNQRLKKVWGLGISPDWKENFPFSLGQQYWSFFECCNQLCAKWGPFSPYTAPGIQRKKCFQFSSERLISHTADQIKTVWANAPPPTPIYCGICLGETVKLASGQHWRSVKAENHLHLPSMDCLRNQKEKPYLRYSMQRGSCGGQGRT